MPKLRISMKKVYSRVGACLSIAILAACAGANNSISSTSMPVAPKIATSTTQLSGSAPHRLQPSLKRQRLALGTEKVLYSFKGGHDGDIPEAGLLAVKGVLYGTTFAGGSNDLGTVFGISTSGKERILYSFYGPARTDGGNPQSGMIAVNGALYGTTYDGGLGCISSCSSQPCGSGSDSGCGTVFEVSTSGSESVVYRFENDSDAAYPSAGLVDVKGTLYGTTQNGGAHGAGTVFSITPSGKETVLHSFAGGSRDGSDPWAGLVDDKGTLFGTTQTGGAKGNGTVFSISPSHKETVIYSFAGGSDGKYSLGDLIDINGTLYGTTSGGGANKDGTVFSITTSGKERVLYSFKGVPDGVYPEAGLTTVGGALYGTTFAGGSHSCNTANFRGCGVVFKVTLSGKEQVLHRFQGAKADGAGPFAPLLAFGGMLYGTTSAGGTSNNGVVYELAP